MNKENIKYILDKKKGKNQIVLYHYIYKDYDILYPIKLPYKEGANKEYYTQLADKEVKKLEESGKLNKYAKTYIKRTGRNLSHNKKLGICIAGATVVVAGVITAVLVNYFSYYKESNVILNSETLTVDKTNVTLHQNAELKLGVKDFYVNYGYTLPTTLTKVAVAGVTLDFDQYTYSNGSLRIDGKFITGTVLITAEANHVEFEDDSWENIVKYANGGLKEVFLRYGRQSVVGHEHDIEINNEKLKVRVIGEGHDRLAGSDDMAATLTFEIEDAGFFTEYADAGSGVTYSGSLVKSKCEQHYQELPSSLKNEIQEVSKYTATNDGYEITSEHLFPLSYREINGYDAINQQYCIEESCYEYYLELDSTKLASKRSKAYQYYLRTPDLGVDGQAFSVSADGVSVASVGYGTPCAVIPAFAIGTTTSFITDSWENVSYYADFGLDELKNHYYRNSFVGLEREIELEGGSDTIQRVRVVGENHDLLSGSNNKVASLTFEFVSPYMNETLNYGDSGNSQYSDSNLRMYLNDLFENTFPEVLKDNIPYVTKKTVRYEDELTPAVETTDERIFALSVREIGDIFFGTAEPYSLEEEAYEYYENGPTLTQEAVKLADKKRNKNGLFYWLRSHYCSGTKAHIVDNIGRTFGIDGSDYNTIVYDVNNIFYCYPAFSLGYSDLGATFANDTWENVCYHAGLGLDHLKEYYGIDTFIGREREITLNNGESEEEPTTTYTVRVIGENEDETPDNKKAALTFEFKTNVTPKTKGCRYFEDETVFPYFTDSVIRSYCNGTVLSYFPEIVRDSIKTVKKKTAALVEPGSFTIEETEDKVFPLSRNEISDNYEEMEVGKDYYLNENPTYSYYQKAKNMVRYKGIKDITKSYWLRTPYLDYSGVGYKNAQCINEFATTYLMPATRYLAVAPAFAI